MEIWFRNADGQECLFISENLMTPHIAERVAENIQAEGWASEVWVKEL